MGCFKNKVTVFILKILFSHVGLCFLVVGYIVMGAYIFRSIELQGEIDRYNTMKWHCQNITEHREKLIESIIEYCTRTPNKTEQVSPNSSKNHIYNMLDDYHDHIERARNETSSWGRQAYKGHDANETTDPPQTLGWDTVSAILFTATIMTTIGYGHIAPVTETGFMICILYSVFAIPLLSMFLLNITGVITAAIRLLYHRGFCRFLERRRDREHMEAHLASNALDNAQYHDEKRRSAWQASAELGNDHRHESDEKRFRPENLVPASLAIIFWVLYLVSGAVMFQAWEENWSMVKAFYFIVVSLFTIGFGDVIPGLTKSGTPKGQFMFGVVAIYIVAGLALTTSVTRLGFDAVKEHFYYKKKWLMEKREAKRAAKRKLNMDELYDKDDNIDHVSMMPVPR